MTDSHGPYADAVARFADLDLGDGPPVYAVAPGDDDSPGDVRAALIAALAPGDVRATGAVAPGQRRAPGSGYDRSGDRLHDASGRSGSTLLGGGTPYAGQTVDVAHALATWGLDWTPILRPLHCDGAPFALSRALVRGPRATLAARGEPDPLAGQALACVGTRYTPIPAVDVFGCLGDSALVERGGETYGGRVQWLQCRIPEHDYAGPDGAEHRAYAVLWARHGDGTAGAGLTDVRTVCQNTGDAAIAGAERATTWRHTASGPARVAAFRDATAAGVGYYGALRREYARLAGVRLTEATARAALAELVPGESTRSGNVRTAMYDAYLRAPGALPGTAYGLWQGLTHYVDHVRAIRTGVDRIGDSLLGGGAELRARAWQTVSVLS